MTDPFTGKQVEISERLIDRLNGKYAVGPTLPNGEPEFGWRYHEVPPIQKEAAATISRLTEERDGLLKLVRGAYAEGLSEGMLEHTSRGAKLWHESKTCEALAALATTAVSDAQSRGQS